MKRTLPTLLLLLAMAVGCQHCPRGGGGGEVDAGAPPGSGGAPDSGTGPGAAPDAGPVARDAGPAVDGGRSCTLGFALQDGECVCAPYCAGIECGDDGCGGDCGTCAKGLVCSTDLHCIPCKPSCPYGHGCLDDGCGQPCAICASGFACDLDAGACLPPDQPPAQPGKSRDAKKKR